MPFSLRMVGELLVVELSDPLSAADLQRGVDDVQQLESTLDVTPNRVLDMRGLRAPALDFATLHSVAERRKAFEPKNPIRTGAVATSPAALGYARMFQTLMANHPRITLKLFDNFEDAERWALGE